MPGRMRFTYRRRIAPGVRLNLSRSGPSLSFGGRGFHYTVGHGRRRTTIGIPGTGLYYTTYSRTHARRSRRTVRRTPQPSGAATIAELFGKRPAAKIGWGLVLTVLVITSPVGVPLLLTGMVQLFMPSWRARALIDRSHGHRGAEARALIDRAAALKPELPEVTAAHAQWCYDQHDWPDAISGYERYLAAVPSDTTAQSHHAQALLAAGRWDDAVAALQAMRSAPLAADGQAWVSAHLALAFLHKGDPEQALAIAHAENLRAQHLGPGQLQCLFARALAAYLTGTHAAAIGDLDRLYALAPGFGGLAETKAAMQAGTFSLT